MCPAASSRWCPTPEQLMILEEMYRSGIRTPNATQIQQITAHLAFYGRVEGKNVFYWFQNHKARDRQKLRKKLARQLHHHQQQHQQPQPQPQPQQAIYQPYHNISSHHHRQLLLHNHHNQYQRFAHHDRMSLSLDSSSAYYPNPSALCLPCQGINGGEAQNKLGMKEYQYCNDGDTWKMDNNIINNPGEHPMFRGSLYGRDWTMMMMMDMGPPPSYPSSLSLSSSSLPCCSITTPRPPLKTLELFPISSSSCKDDTTKP